MTLARIRRPVSAGEHAFYSSNPVVLRENILALLNRGVKPAPTDPPVALVCPHAGYVYSGETAARAYATLRQEQFDRVIVAGPSHYAIFAGASIYEGDAYATPLGEIPLDKDFISKLRLASKAFIYDPFSEEREHSIEVQLPFLQTVLGEFSLVPILIYDSSEENCTTIADAIAATLLTDEAGTLLVASSDLYHGPGADVARKTSQAAAQAVARGDATQFSQGIQAGEYMACGAGAVSVILKVAERLGAKRTELLHVTTSYEVYPSREDYVVGYMSAAFYKN